MDRWIRGVALALVVLALVGGWMTYTTTVAPGTHTETRTVEEWGTTTWFEHSSVVTEPNPVFQNGTVLENRSVYFTRVSSRLDGQYGFVYDTPASGDLRAETTVWLTLRRVGGRDGAEYWNVTEPLAESTTASVTPGDAVRVPFAVDTTVLRARLTEITSRLGPAPGRTEVVVTARTRLTGQVGGRDVSRVVERSLPVVLDDSLTRMGGARPSREPVTATRVVDVPNTYGAGRTALGGGLLLAGLAGLAGLVVARRRGALAPSSAELAAVHHTAFRDWITVGVLPDEVLEYPVVRVESLEGLVDLAADTNRRIVNDRSLGIYVVVIDGVRYQHDPSGFRWPR